MICRRWTRANKVGVFSCDPYSDEVQGWMPRHLMDRCAPLLLAPEGSKARTDYLRSYVDALQGKQSMAIEPYAMETRAKIEQALRRDFPDLRTDIMLVSDEIDALASWPHGWKDGVGVTVRLKKSKKTLEQARDKVPTRDYKVAQMAMVVSEYPEWFLMYLGPSGMVPVKHRVVADDKMEAAICKAATRLLRDASGMLEAEND